MDKNVNTFYQHCSDTRTRQLQPFNAYKAQSPHPPPNLHLPNKGSGQLPQAQWNTYNSTSALENTGSIQYLNKIPVMSEAFLPSNEQAGPAFRPHYDDQHIQNSAEPLCYEPYSPQCINQIVNSFQSLKTTDHGHLLPGDVPLLTGEKVGLYQEEKLNHLTASTHTPSTTHISKEMVGDYGKIHMERNRVARSKMSKCTSGSRANVPNPQNFQQTQFYSGSLQNRQQKIPLATKNVLPANVKGNHHYRSHSQQGQSRNKPQPAKEKRRTHMSGFQGEGYSTRGASNFHQKAAENVRFPPPNGLQTRTYTTDNGRGKSLQLGPPAYNANDPAGHSGVNFSSFISRSKTPHGGSFIELETYSTMAANEVVDLGPVLSDAVNNQAAANLNVAASANAMNEVPLKQLQLYLEECHNQWKLLEMETEMVSLTVLRVNIQICQMQKLIIWEYQQTCFLLLLPLSFLLWICFRLKPFLARLLLGKRQRQWPNALRNNPMSSNSLSISRRHKKK